MKQISRPTRRSLLKMTAGVSAATLTGGVTAAWRLANPTLAQAAAPEAQFKNPLFAGDYPDPTILRVGADFYMTHTSYSFTPGLVVWHSRDLVNWTPISHAVDETHGEVWAPDLVEHNGRYFIYFPMGGIFVVHADHPAGTLEPAD